MQQVFDRYINYLTAERNASRYTVRNYATDLLGGTTEKGQKGFFQFLRLKNVDTLDQVDRQVIRDYLGWLMEQGIVRNSISRKYSSVRSFFKYLVREELITTNPAETGVSPRRDQRLPSVLSVEEVVRLLEAPDLSKAEGLRDRALLELLYASGLRVSEVVNLDRGQVDFDTNEIRVYRGKGTKDRMVLIGEPAARALTAYLTRSRPELLGEKSSDALFVSRQGERLLERRIQKILEKYTHVAGIGKRVYPHILRHTFATHMLDGGADLRVVQELLGHADLSSTQIYTQVSKSQARKVYLSAHPLAKAQKEVEQVEQQIN
jgi:integrase/recombinase XerC